MSWDHVTNFNTSAILAVYCFVYCILYTVYWEHAIMKSENFVSTGLGEISAQPGAYKLPRKLG